MNTEIIDQVANKAGARVLVERTEDRTGLKDKSSPRGSTSPTAGAARAASAARTSRRGAAPRTKRGRPPVRTPHGTR
jgi:hypothetical protein